MDQSSFEEVAGQGFSVAAVISGYKRVAEPVYQGSDGTGLSIYHNTGIIVAVPLKSALDLIDLNPIGFALD